MNRIENEKKTVGMMLRLYCRRYEGNKELCQDCSQLRTVLAKFLVSFIPPTVEPEHHPYRLLLVLYPVHHIINIIFYPLSDKIT